MKVPDAGALRAGLPPPLTEIGRSVEPVMRRARIAAAGVLFLGSYTATADEPGVRILAEGLNAPRGICVTEAGAIFVALAGSGGPGTAVDHPAAPFKIGYGKSGGVVRIDPDGSRADVVTDIASLAFQGAPDGKGPPKGFEAHGVHDVVVEGGDRVVVTNGFSLPPNLRESFMEPGEEQNFASVVVHEPAGVQVLVDIGDYEQAHDPDGRGLATNPFSIAAHPDGGYLVTDAAANALFHFAENDLDPSVVASFERFDLESPEGPVNVDAVPTGVAMHPDGEHVLVAEFGGAPFLEGGSRVMKVNLHSGEKSVFADDLTQVVDIAALPDGRVAALQYMNKSMAPPGRNAPDAGIVILSRNGDRLSELLQIGALKTATGLAAGGDGTLYVSSNGNTGENKGTLVAIDVDKVLNNAR